MNSEKRAIINMMVGHFIIGIIAIVIKMIKPEYATVRGIIDAIASRDILVVFFTSIIPIFVLFSYILFIMGLYLIGHETIGRLINFIKDIFSNSNFYGHDYYEVDYIEIAIIAAYVFFVIPLLLSILWSALLSVTLIILVIYIILGALS